MVFCTPTSLTSASPHPHLTRTTPPVSSAVPSRPLPFSLLLSSRSDSPLRTRTRRRACIGQRRRRVSFAGSGSRGIWGWLGRRIWGGWFGRRRRWFGRGWRFARRGVEESGEGACLVARPFFVATMEMAHLATRTHGHREMFSFPSHFTSTEPFRRAPTSLRLPRTRPGGR